MPLLGALPDGHLGERCPTPDQNAGDSPLARTTTSGGLNSEFLNSAARMLCSSPCDTLLNGSVQMSTVSREVETGTTTLGLVCKDGVVLAADRRATAGTLIAHKRTKKVYKLDDNIGLTTAGLVGDLQVLARYITAEVELYKLKRGISMPVEACATLTANILSGSRFYPYWVQLVIGGWDRAGGHVYSLDAAGGSLPDKFVSSGSGSPYVYGVLEDHYTDGMTTEEGANLAVRAVTAAMKRDAVSGEGIDVAIITKDGFKMLDDKEVEKRKTSMKLA